MAIVSCASISKLHNNPWDLLLIINKDRIENAVMAV